MQAFISPSLTIRLHRLTVRTPGSHPGNRSSILRGVTNKNSSPYGGLFLLRPPGIEPGLVDCRRQDAQSEFAYCQF
jgi:hypothetical protein